MASTISICIDCFISFHYFSGDSISLAAVISSFHFLRGQFRFLWCCCLYFRLQVAHRFVFQSTATLSESIRCSLADLQLPCHVNFMRYFGCFCLQSVIGSSTFNAVHSSSTCTCQLDDQIDFIFLWSTGLVWKAQPNPPLWTVFTWTANTVHATAYWAIWDSKQCNVFVFTTVDADYATVSDSLGHLDHGRRAFSMSNIWGHQWQSWRGVK